MFNWQIRTELHHFKNEGRLAILLCMVLHKNARNRAYPSIQTLAKETGYAKTAIIAGIQWLLDHYAIIPVIFEYRAGDEKKLHKRRNIFQVTGVIELDGHFHRYLHMTPEQWSGIAEEINAIAKGSYFEPLKVHISELQNSEPQEGISNSSKDGSKKVVSRKSASTQKVYSKWQRQDVLDYYALHTAELDMLVDAWGYMTRFKDMTIAEAIIFARAYEQLRMEDFNPAHYSGLVVVAKSREGWKKDFSPLCLTLYITDYREGRLAEPPPKANNAPRKETYEEAKRRLGVIS